MLFRSIKYKFLFSILIMFIVFLTLIIYEWYSITSKDAENSSIAYVNETFKESNKNFENALQDINSVVINLTFDTDVIDILTKTDYATPKDQLDDLKKMNAIMRNLYSYKHYLNGLLIGSLNGQNYVAGSSSYEDTIAQPWFKTIMQPGNDIVIIPPHYYDRWTTHDANSDYRNMVLTLGKPLVQGNDPIGFVIADIKSDILNDIFNINLKDNGTVFVIDNHSGEFIFKPDQSNPPAEFKNLDIKKISKKIVSNQGSFYHTIGNQDYLVIYYSSSFTKWTTIGLVPKAKLLESYNQKVKKFLIYSSILFCSLVVAATYLISSLLTTNLLKLNKAMKQIDKENLNISIQIHSKDEIGQLYQQFTSMIVRIRELINDINHREKEKRSSDLRALQSQINPHFLHNTLNTIKFLAVLQGADNIKGVSESLSTLLHINMEERNFITIEEELDYIRSYLNIQKFKYSNKFTASFHVEEDIKTYMVLKLLLQPLVENALEYGIGPLSTQGDILIKIYKEGHALKLRVQDNGPGMDQEWIAKLLNPDIQTKGIGIRNTISRIKLNFGDDFGIFFLSEPYLYTIAEISVPLITKDEVEKHV